MAAKEGNFDITTKLLPLTPRMCWWLDCQNLNPVHIAAINGHAEVLRVLLQNDYLPAMERVYRGQTVLHLCVKHRQLRSLKVLVEKLGELVDAKDEDGETIFHLAVRSQQLDIIKYLVEDNIIKKDTPNSAGKTALKILRESPPFHTSNYSEIKSILSRLPDDNHRLNEVWRLKASLMAATVAGMGIMASQAMVNPPGGVWQNDSLTHKAGEAVVASTRPTLYQYFVRANTTTFGISNIIILLIFIGVTFKCLDIAFCLILVSNAASYIISLLMTSPNEETQSVHIFWIAIAVIFIMAIFQAIWNCRSNKNRYALVTNTTPAITVVLHSHPHSKKLV
ncbi:hypothetical protein C2S51_003405 [Perilla frutescens var. frutescens]|nr:hypothetical protein C2S51_003405 [Perilla frutescens var. frutescens]